MRSWIPPPTRLAGPVMIVQLPIRSPSGDFHVLRRPANAKGRRSGSEKCIGLRGCLGSSALSHSYQPSAGTRQRLRASSTSPRNDGRSVSDSIRALMRSGSFFGSLDQ